MIFLVDAVENKRKRRKNHAEKIEKNYCCCKCIDSTIFDVAENRKLYCREGRTKIRTNPKCAINHNKIDAYKCAVL